MHRFTTDYREAQSQSLCYTCTVCSLVNWEMTHSWIEFLYPLLTCAPLEGPTLCKLFEIPGFWAAPVVGVSGKATTGEYARNHRKFPCHWEDSNRQPSKQHFSCQPLKQAPTPIRMVQLCLPGRLREISAARLRQGLLIPCQAEHHHVCTQMQLLLALAYSNHPAAAIDMACCFDRYSGDTVI